MIYSIQSTLSKIITLRDCPNVPALRRVKRNNPGVLREVLVQYGVSLMKEFTVWSLQKGLGYRDPETGLLSRLLSTNTTFDYSF